MKNVVHEMFSESSGTSSMRLVFVIGVLAIIFVWAWLSIEQGVPISFGAMDVGALAVLVGGKDVQKFFETRKG